MLQIWETIGFCFIKNRLPPTQVSCGFDTAFLTRRNKVAKNFITLVNVQFWILTSVVFSSDKNSLERWGWGKSGVAGLSSGSEMLGLDPRSCTHFFAVSIHQHEGLIRPWVIRKGSNYFQHAQAFLYRKLYLVSLLWKVGKTAIFKGSKILQVY